MAEALLDRILRELRERLRALARRLGGEAAAEAAVAALDVDASRTRAVRSPVTPPSRAHGGGRG
jgi:hypothetical protein